MKSPTKCPFCNDPLLNIFPPAEDLTNKVNKYCNKRIDHNIAMIVEDDEVVSLSIGLDINQKLQVTWLFNLKEVWLWTDPKKGGRVTLIPFFEPDLSNYRKLVDKVKTYLLFS